MPQWRDLLAVLVILAVALWQNLAHVDRSPFHPDETRWINRAHYVRDLADPLGQTWSDHHLTRGQPPAGSYLMGIGLLAQGRDLTTNGVWRFDRGPIWNIRNGNMSSRADLIAGRRTNAVVGALTVAAVYVLGSLLVNRLGGLTAALFLALHPLMIRLSSQALADVLLIFLLALAGIAACRLADRPTWTRTVTLGVALALAGATKLSPLLLAVPLAGLGVLLLAWPHPTWPPRGGVLDPGARPLGRMLLALPLIAATAFVVSYPYLWPDPVARTRLLFEFRASEMAKQGDNWPAVAVGSRAEAIDRVWARLGEDFSTTGRLLAELAGREPVAGLDLLFAFLGAAILIGRAAVGGPRSRHVLAGGLLLAQAALIVAGLRSDYARYHLPILLAVAVFVGVAVGETATILPRLAGRFARGRRTRPAGAEA